MARQDKSAAMVPPTLTLSACAAPALAISIASAAWRRA
jgi:hypothetical protein